MPFIPEEEQQGYTLVSMDDGGMIRVCIEAYSFLRKLLLDGKTGFVEVAGLYGNPVMIRVESITLLTERMPSSLETEVRMDEANLATHKAQDLLSKGWE